ncbi:MAG: FAD-dependent oxidoreductase [Thaumarchaeota archaeon]|nr:FAD-dependent oxidoreductase [Nitrososphaerota archaeon]
MEKYDAVIVGAGLAGCAAALSIARRGFDVIMLEKARVPGHRNMTGGVIFAEYIRGYGLQDLIPDLKDAPLERRIKKHEVHLLSGSDSEGKTYRIYSLTRGSFPVRLGLVSDPSTGHDYSVLRAKFDRWFAGKAMEAGAMMATECAVEELINKDDRIIGVKTVDEEIYADMVIDASGVTSPLPIQAGLREPLGTESYYLGAKHVYRLSSGTIEERFKLGEGEGVAQLYLGPFMKGVHGGAFLYTNRESLSVGIVIDLNSFVKKSEQDLYLGKPLDLMEAFERHPIITNYLEGASFAEYSAHTVPKGYSCILDRPYATGFLVAGDALGSFVKIGPMLDGMRRAIASGIMAAETFEHAKKEGDFSARTLSRYKEVLKPIYDDVSRSRRDSKFFESSFAYSIVPSIIFGLGLGNKVTANSLAKAADNRDAIEKIQERTGLLTYDEDKEYVHIKVNLEACSKSSFKPWVAACPFNCYTLVLPKGVFASYRDLLQTNLQRLREQSRTNDDAVRSEAERLTRQDIATGTVRFDHVACVGCGTCGILGPHEAIQFGPERKGHGVRYAYG